MGNIQEKIKLKYKKDNRGLRNLFAGLSYQIVSVGMGLLLPHVFITNLGSESNGLLSSVGQVFTCLGLLEAGVGAATIQALYKPVAEGDLESINSILSATNRYYRKTGQWYALSIVILAVIYPFLVDSNLSTWIIRGVILLQGAGAVVTYLFQAKYTLLLKAEGKNYVITLLSLGILLFRNIGKIILIRLGYNIIAVQFIQLFTVIAEAAFIICYIKRHYQWLSIAKKKPNYNAISQKNSVLAQSAAWMVFNHTDVLVLTVFTRDLSLISVYSVYLLVFEAAQNVLNEIRGSFQYKLGFLAQNSDTELDRYFIKYSERILFLAFGVFTVVYLIATPFVNLYTAGVTDTQYVLKWVPELFFFYKVLYY